jgi:Rrf2 family transcriptional regulator, iron-sulfur cluster assembly transcription factor
MQLTRGGEYGLRGVLHLAHQGDGTISMVSAIAEAQSIPPRFLAKIFQALAKAGVVKSHRGAKGGFSLGRPASEITLRDVIEAIEGPICLGRDQTEPTHGIWKGVQQELIGVLTRDTFADLAKLDRWGHATEVKTRVDSYVGRGALMLSRATPIAADPTKGGTRAISAG